ncbi:MRC1-like domain-containing protein [Scheffersomyces coipomensis]|uniref:MRC1-like domain-containing protein n=1 Tax=Scheffersomyces coipomensis TaxID=1788519 RepID=UPI00315C9FE0
MDLLDGLDENLSSTQLNQIQLSYNNDESSSSDEEEEGEHQISHKQDQSNDQSNDLRFNFDIGALAKSLSKDSGLNLNLLNGIRKRLTGDDNKNEEEVEENEEEDDHVNSNQLQQSTQIEPTQEVSIPFDFNFDNSMLKDEDEDHEDTPTSGQEIQKLPQLEIDASEFISNESSTQVIHNNNNTINDTQPIISKPTTDLNSLFLSQDDDEEEENDQHQSEKENNYKPLSKEERLAKIEKLAQIKRQQRLEKEQKEQQLQDELNTTTLTDEENDLNNEFNDSVVSNANPTDHVSSKQLKEAEQFLNVQKRNKDIRPEFEKKIVFTKQKLLSAFNDDDDDEEQHHTLEKESSPLGLYDHHRSSPHTSPVKTISKKPISSDEEEDDDVDEELDVVALINKKPTVQSQTQTRNPIESYAQNLKRQLFSSPTKSDNDERVNQRLINLDDSDSDLEINSSSPIRNSTNLPKTNINNNNKFVIPELSKDQKITIKQKFVKKKLLNSKLPQNLVVKNLGHKTNLKESNDFLLNLQRANILQLKANRTNGETAVLEEMEKDEEVMGSLLEQEMERVRRIRVREKLREKAKLALLGKLKGKNGDDDGEEEEDDAVPDSDVPESEVPDSDYGSDVGSGSDADNGELIDYEAEEDSEEGEEEVDEEDEGQPEVSHRKSKRVILSDDDEEGEVEMEDNEDLSELRNHDDSYMFGGKQDKEHDHKLEGVITTASSQSFQNNPSENILSTLKETQTLEDEDDDNDNEHDVSRFNNDNYVLFQNLKPRQPSQQQSTQISEDLANKSFNDFPLTLPSFRDISEPNTQNDSIISTQADTIIKTQVDANMTTQVDDAETQVIEKPKNDEYDEEDEDVITPSKVKTGRKLIRKNTSILNDINEEEAEEEEDEVNEEEEKEAMELKIKMYEEKIRKQELKQRKKRKEFERRGLKDMVEGEAEESEDEWKGLGGMDGELSDQANSDDERMIDNDFNIDLKDDEIRKKFMEDYQIKDQKELEKLLDDIKNHRLTKKVAGNGLDLELSDEEDQLLAAYRKQRLQEQRERLAESKKMHAFVKSEKAKAFFMEEEPTIIRLHDDEEEEDDEEEIEEDTSSRKSKSKSPFTGEDGTDGDDEEDDIIEKEPPVKKTIKIEESFVQRQLSFLHKNKDHDYENIQRISNKQHGIDSSDDEIIDVKELKSKSLSNLTSKRSESPMTIVEEPVEPESRKRSIDELHDTDVDDDDIMPSFKKPSIIGSFKSFHEQQGIQIKDGKKHFSGVTISKQYKVASGSKASITYMSKKTGSSNKPIKSLKEKRIQRSINSSKAEVKKIFSNEGFE